MRQQEKAGMVVLLLHTKTPLNPLSCLVLREHRRSRMLRVWRLMVVLTRVASSSSSIWWSECDSFERREVFARQLLGPAVDGCSLFQIAGQQIVHSASMLQPNTPQ